MLNLDGNFCTTLSCLSLTIGEVYLYERSLYDGLSYFFLSLLGRISMHLDLLREMEKKVALELKPDKKQRQRERGQFHQ